MVALWISGKHLIDVEDAKVWPWLRTLNRSVELRDEDGAVLGEFVAAPDPRYAEWVDMSPEEIERIQASPSYTYEEVKRMLGRE